MKLNIPENPKSHRISTYLTAEEIADLAKVVGDQSTASWLRTVVLKEIDFYKNFNKQGDK
jgi:hypothetical protein